MFERWHWQYRTVRMRRLCRKAMNTARNVEKFCSCGGFVGATVRQCAGRELGTMPAQSANGFRKGCRASLKSHSAFHGGGKEKRLGVKGEQSRAEQRRVEWSGSDVKCQKRCTVTESERIHLSHPHLAQSESGLPTTPTSFQLQPCRATLKIKITIASLEC